MWFSAAEIAKFGEMLIARLPGTMRGATLRAQNERWACREVPGKGGKGGVKTEYQPPAPILKAMHSHLQTNPDFLSKANKEETEMKSDESGDGDVQYGRRADDFRHANLEDFIQVPRYDLQASAGSGAVVHSERIVDHLAFRAEWIKNSLGVSPRNLALISVKGDSMVPTLFNDDLILVDVRIGRIEDDAIYVLQHDGDLRVKRIQRKLDGTVIIKSDNKQYSDETFAPSDAAELSVIGRVVWFGRRM